MCVYVTYMCGWMSLLQYVYDFMLWFYVGIIFVIGKELSFFLFFFLY